MQFVRHKKEIYCKYTSFPFLMKQNMLFGKTLSISNIVKAVILAFFIFSVKPLEAARPLDVMKSKLAAIKVSIPQKRAQVPPSSPNPLCIYIYIYVVKAWLHFLDLSKNCYNIGTRLCDNWQLITISFREFYENLKSRDTFCLLHKLSTCHLQESMHSLFLRTCKHYW